MEVRNARLRKAYIHVKAATIAERIRSITKAPHDEGQQVSPKPYDNIGGVPSAAKNEDVTDPRRPDAHQQPEDPEFNTDQIISGTGDGPAKETNRDYL